MKTIKKSANVWTVIVGLQVLILMGQWFGANAPSAALAQIPDAGAQRNEMVDQLKGINSKLDTLVTLLQDGKLQVRTSGSDEKNTAR